MANELKDGQTRFGFIFDGIAESPHVAVQITRSPSRIEMSLPWLDEYNGMHQRWFGQGIDWGDDPDRTKFLYQVPERIAFVDPSGSIALVGCRATGYNSNLGFGVGIGRASVQFAVLGAKDADAYEAIHGLRSELEGLGDWVGLRSLEHVDERDADGKLSVATLRLKSPDPILVSTSPRLEIRPGYRYGPGDHPDETVIKERMLVQSLARTSSDWWTHLDRHFAVRDLVRVAAWRRLNFLSHEVTRDDDPIQMLDGSSRGRAWRKVETALTGQVFDASKIQRSNFTFHYGDMTKAGMNRWLELHLNEPRVVQPLLKLLELDGASLETHVAQLGMGLEALAYRVALNSGVSKRIAKDEPMAKRLARVVQHLGIDLPFDAAACPEVIAAAYNSVKHANRDLPPPDDLLRAYRIGIQLFRIWVMDLVGIRRSRAKELLARDRLTNLINRD